MVAKETTNTHSKCISILIANGEDVNRVDKVRTLDRHIELGLALSLLCDFAFIECTWGLGYVTGIIIIAPHCTSLLLSL